MPARPAVAIGVVLLAAAGVIGAIAYFNARDDATVSTSRGPGRERPEGERPVVQAGNVLLVYSDSQLSPALRALQREIAGTDKALAAVGQAVLVRRQDELPVPVSALSARHRLDASRAELPALRNFVEYWLGRESG
ncbi:MAG: hypothetical protein M3401_15025 [Actinomycetota bacterium]|nr:hypothetical protein [Actinomycetota bacterium]